MKMKKYFLLALVVLTGIASSCKYDDDDLWENVNDLADRVTSLEAATKQMNSDIAAMQSIISALQNQVTVSKVEELKDGYIIHFSDGTKATIKNGADGKDGANGADGKDGVDGENGKDGKDGANAPIINVKQEGGVYYWTITVDGKTEWLTDEDGNKLRVSGEDGEDGKDGTSGSSGKNGNTPLLKVNAAGNWTVSYDNGATYTEVKDVNNQPIKAKGENGVNGDSKFTSIKMSDGIVTIKYNGKDYVIPVAASVSYKGLDGDVVTLEPKGSVTLAYTVTEMPNASVEVVKAPYFVSVEAGNGKLTIKAKSTSTEAGKIVLLYYNANKTITSVLTVKVTTTAGTAADLQTQLNAGGMVSLGADIDVEQTINMSENCMLDGQGHKISGTLTTYSTPAILTAGGTIKNLSVVTGCAYSIAADKLKADLYLENVTTDKTGYGINLRGKHEAEYAFYATGCTFKGWSSFTAVTKAIFTDCKFGQGEYWVNNGYSDYYDRLVKPYVTTEFVDCEFDKGFYIDLSSFTGTSVIFKNCKVDGVALTKDMFKNITESASNKMTIEELGDKKLWHEGSLDKVTVQ